MTPSPKDIRAMAAAYTEAWSSHVPSKVADFYEDDGILTINVTGVHDGRDAVTAMAQGFYDAVPDLKLHLDDVRSSGNTAIFVWTFTGHDAGTAKPLKIRGWEAWTLSDNLRVAESKGWYDAAEYEHQIREGYAGD